MDKELAQLEAVLRDEIAAHERLLAALARKLAALRRADHRQVTACCQEENRQVQAIGDLEKKRLTLVAELTRHLDPAAPAPTAMVDLARRLDEPARGRLLVLRQQLRQRVEQVRKEAAVARQSAQVLLAHMQGLVQTVGALVTGVGLYGRGGAPPRAAAAISTFQTTA